MRLGWGVYGMYFLSIFKFSLCDLSVRLDCVFWVATGFLYCFPNCVWNFWIECWVWLQIASSGRACFWMRKRFIGTYRIDNIDWNLKPSSTLLKRMVLKFPTKNVLKQDMGWRLKMLDSPCLLLDRSKRHENGPDLTTTFASRTVFYYWFVGSNTSQFYCDDGLGCSYPCWSWTKN